MVVTKEIKEFLNESEIIPYSKKLEDFGFLNSKNVTSNKIIKKNGVIIFTIENIIEFCKKYNLYFAESKRFIGNIPAKNIKKIEEYTPHDPVYAYSYDYGDYIFYTNNLIEKTKNGFFSLKLYRYNGQVADRYSILNSSYHIIAPKNEFNVEMDEVTRTLKANDPAIFERYFDIELNKYMYQLITCWGKEEGAVEFQDENLN